MTNIRKKRPIRYGRELNIYCPHPVTAQKLRAVMAEKGIDRIPDGIRYQIDHRRVELHFTEFSLDDAMWLLTSIRKELQLLQVSITQIKKKMAQMRIMHAEGDLIDNQIFDALTEHAERKAAKIYDITAQLSYLWLPK